MRATSRRFSFVLVPDVAHGSPEQAADRYTALLGGFIHRELTVREPM